ncbi:MAG: Multimodular transpeptidase-transglycosylase, partial [uncultured Frankineae bacterium]
VDVEQPLPAPGLRRARERGGGPAARRRRVPRGRWTGPDGEGRRGRVPRPARGAGDLAARPAHPHPGRRRLAAGGALPAEPRQRAAGRHPRAAAPGGHRHGGRALLPPPRRRLQGHDPRGRVQRPGRRGQPGRFDADPAVRQERPAAGGRGEQDPAGRRARGVAGAQDEGGALRPGHRADDEQGRDPRALPQHRLLRQRRLRRRHGGQLLLRQAGAEAQPVRERHPRRHRPEPRALRSRQGAEGPGRHAGAARATGHRAVAHDVGRLHHRAAAGRRGSGGLHPAEAVVHHPSRPERLRGPRRAGAVLLRPHPAHAGVDRRGRGTRRHARGAPERPAGRRSHDPHDPRPEGPARRAAGGRGERAADRHLPPCRLRRGRGGRHRGARHRCGEGHGGQPPLHRVQGPRQHEGQPGHRRLERLPGRLDLQGVRAGGRAAPGLPAGPLAVLAADVHLQGLPEVQRLRTVRAAERRRQRGGHLRHVDRDARVGQHLLRAAARAHGRRGPGLARRVDGRAAVRGRAALGPAQPRWLLRARWQRRQPAGDGRRLRHLRRPRAVLPAARGRVHHRRVGRRAGAAGAEVQPGAGAAGRRHRQLGAARRRHRLDQRPHRPQRVHRPARRGQDRHHQRLQGRLVRRLHPAARDRRVGRRPRRAGAGGQGDGGRPDQRPLLLAGLRRHAPGGDLLRHDEVGARGRGGEELRRAHGPEHGRLGAARAERRRSVDRAGRARPDRGGAVGRGRRAGVRCPRRPGQRRLHPATGRAPGGRRRHGHAVRVERPAL